MNIIFEPFYLPVYSLFSYISICEKAIIDDQCFFHKQRYYNRCYILGANKIIPLIIPIKSAQSKQLLKNVRIDYSTNWRKNHWNSICSAYGKSPWFEFFKFDLSEILFKQYEFLIDLNVDLLQLFLRLLNLNQIEIKFSSECSSEINIEIDLRNMFHPKNQKKELPLNYQDRSYLQVFGSRFGFVKGLSIIDLLCNLGLESKEYLLSLVKNN